MSVQSIGDGDFQTAVLQSSEPVLVDFFSTWCQPCKALEPVLDELATRYSGRVRFIKMNVDEAPETAAMCGITGAPTLILFHGGEEQDRKAGAPSKPILERWLKSYAA